jgi:hypothetical protein
MTGQQLQERIAARAGGEEALALIAKLGFNLDFVARSVLSGGEVTVPSVAMLWMGMPNKHERKKTAQLFDLLSAHGLLRAVDGKPETWQPGE